MKSRKKAAAAAIAGNVIFGLSFMFSRVVLLTVDTFVMLALRFSLAFLAMNVLVCARVVKVDLKKDLRPLLALGLFQPVLYFTFESLGIKLTNSVISGSMIATVPVAGMLLGAVFLYAIGGGLIEVLISPIVEACPTDNKASVMSLLHSFYCWGSVGVILLSTLFLQLFGKGSWTVLALLWALLPLANALWFTKVPIAHLTEEGEGLPLGKLLTNKLFWIFAALMFAAGACELSMSQWASAFAESGLGVSKTVGDLAGPCLFAVLMGCARVIYAKFGDRLNLLNTQMLSAGLCVVAYLLAALSPNPLLALLGCGLCGLSVGILWPGTISVASRSLPKGGTAMFALLALFGDLGCSGGPTLVGMVSGAFGGELKTGLLFAVVFPVFLIAAALACKRALRHRKAQCLGSQFTPGGGG